MCSAHTPTKKNIGVKFHDNQSRGSGGMQQRQNSRVNPLTLTCDIDLESR